MIHHILVSMPRISIEKLVFGGQGLGRSNNQVAFIWGALPGEVVDYKITKNKKNYIEGVATAIISPSPYRVLPLDSHYLCCSPWQILDYAEENKWKQEIALETYRKIGGINLENIEMVAPTEPYHYRNKMEYSFTTASNGQVSLGLFQRETHRLQALEKCALPEAVIHTVGESVVAWLNREAVPITALKSIIIRSNGQGQAIAALFVKDKNFMNDRQSLPPEVSGELTGFHVYYSNPFSPASVATELLYNSGATALMAEFKGKKLQFGLFSFFQVNIPVFEKALHDIGQFLDSKKDIVDYYGGVGSISLPLAERFRQGIIVESAVEAVADAQKNIAENDIKNVSVKAALAENDTGLIAHDKIIIVDPPRAGLHPSVVASILRERPERVVYLSCDLGTQARDLKLLLAGYRPIFWKLYNFFPRTPHSEGLCVLDRIPHSV